MILRVFIGFDYQEAVAYSVLAHSIMRHASAPVSITPLRLDQLNLNRPRDPNQSTDFAYSRFLVPHLCDYEGYAIFMDCDMLMMDDIYELFEGVDKNAAVSVVKHDYVPKNENKFLDQKQTSYVRKNWSSLMVFNNAQCRNLSRARISAASGMHLHQFQWVEGNQTIGSIDPAWNHLVGEYPENPEAKNVHFTLGTPCFAKYKHCEYAEAWRAERALMLHHNPMGEFSLPAKDAA